MRKSVFETNGSVLAEEISPQALGDCRRETDDSGAGPVFKLRDYLFYLDWALDTESQLVAIRGLLSRMQQAEIGLTEEIRQIGDHGQKVSAIDHQPAVDEWRHRVNHSVYQDAARSMAAVGMLAPFVESLFLEGFRSFSQHFFFASPPNPSHERWRRAAARQWDCRFVIKSGRAEKNVVQGIMQLAEATGLSQQLPSDLEATLRALFCYQSKIFHHGLEWPLNERLHFERTMKKHEWPRNWFWKATSGNDPWIFYMATDFLSHCLAIIEKVLDAFSEFVREELRRRPNRQTP